MRVDVVFKQSDESLEGEITVEGWLINASNQGLGRLFYLVEDKIEHNDTRRAIFLVRGTSRNSPEEARLADVLSFLAPYGRLSPIEARITGRLTHTDEQFPLMLTNLERIEVMIPKWGYTGYFMPSGLDYEEIGVGRLSPIPVIDLLQNKDLFIGANIKLSGVLTGSNATRYQPEMCYVTDRRYLARPPALSPLHSERLPEQFVRDLETRQRQRRAAYEAQLIRERRNAVLVKYDGILRKIIPPHYSGRAFFENVIITGELDAVDVAPFPVAMVSAGKLLIKNIKDEQHSVQVWDLRTFPYGRNI